MAETTGISWTDATFNPWIGCEAISPGCKNCYAEAMAKRMGRDFAERTRTSEANWRKPFVWQKYAEQGISPDGKTYLGRSPRVFCASMADVFDNKAPMIWRHDLWKTMLATRALTWLVLTKRVGNAAKMWQEWPPNVWLGATIIDREEMIRDAPKLKATQAQVQFWSVEPMLGNLGEIPRDLLPDWVIVGGESGGKRREMDMEAARGLIRQCKDVGVPVFVKQDSGPRPGMQGRFTDEEWALKEFPINSWSVNG